MKGFNPPYHNPVLAKILQSSKSSRVKKKRASPSDHLKWRPIMSEFCDPVQNTQSNKDHELDEAPLATWYRIPPDPL